MVDIVRLERVEQLPDVPIVDTVYYVLDADGEIAEQYVVGDDGVLVPVSLSAPGIAAEVLAEVQPQLAGIADAALLVRLPAPRTVTASTTAVNGDVITADTDAGGFTVLAPADGGTFTVVGGTSLLANPVTILGNGRSFDADDPTDTTLVVDIPNVAVKLTSAPSVWLWGAA